MAPGLGIVLGIGLYVGPIGMVCPEIMIKSMLVTDGDNCEMLVTDLIR